MLIVFKEEIPKSISKAEILIGTNSKVSMDIDKGDPENISLPNGKGLPKIKLFNIW